MTDTPKLSRDDRTFIRRAIAACLLGGLLWFGLAVYVIVDVVEDARNMRLMSSEIRYLELIKTHPPHHSFADLRDLETGVVVPEVVVSQNCTRWHVISPGKIFQIDADKYRDDRNGAVKFVYKGLHKIFCSS